MYVIYFYQVLRLGYDVVTKTSVIDAACGMPIIIKKKLRMIACTTYYVFCGMVVVTLTLLSV